MSIMGWSSGWESLNGLDSRRHGGLSKMMALSFFLHLFFSIFLLVGRPFFGIRPPVQSYQVSLVSPAPDSISVQGSPFRSGGRANPDRVQPPSAFPIPIQTAARPSVSARAPKMETKPDPDPERLQEWWKKAGSIKVPTIQPKSPPLKEPARVDITKRQTKTEPPNPLSLAASSNKAAPTDEKAAEKAAPLDPTAPVQTGSASQLSVVAAGKASLDQSLFKFPWYLQKMENKISGQWAPPPLALEGEWVGAVIQFSVGKDGGIEFESVKVEKSSGNNFFDQAAMRAVYAAHPFPPLPDGLNEDRLRVHFSFTLQKGS